MCAVDGLSSPKERESQSLIFNRHDVLCMDGTSRPSSVYLSKLDPLSFYVEAWLVVKESKQAH